MVWMKEGLLPISLSPSHDIMTPLRYPGGKSALFGFVSSLIGRCGCAGGKYVEPFAGGAGLALRLLEAKTVTSVVINDFDDRVFAFWDAAVNHSEGFIKVFDETEPTIEEWHRQRELLKSSDDPLEVGFAFFFINRTSRSGVANGGVIGGLAQQGTYKVNARYNKTVLRNKLLFLQANSDLISVRHVDGVSLVRDSTKEKNTFFFIDPPYVQKGRSLYLNALQKSDHELLASVLHESRNANWLLTYDDDPLIRGLYKSEFCGVYQLDYSVHRRRRAAELMIASDSVRDAVDRVLEEGSGGKNH